MVVPIIILIVLLGLVFWLGSMVLATAIGSPVVYSKKESVRKAYRLAGLQVGETVLDLGCGNCQNLILAAKEFGAKGIGVDRSLYCFLVSNFKIWLAGESGKIQVIWGGFDRAEKLLQKVDVVYLYLLNSTLAEIEPWFFRHLGKNVRAVSLAFKFPNHKPIKEKPVTNLGIKTKIRLYGRA
jgi:SAM-dependent methyltransferase